MELLENIHIGTSGWHYDHWKGPFYPENITVSKMLKYYCDYFHTVEINNTFYQLPDKKTFFQWRDTVGDNFIFSVKASRYITHMKKLKEPIGVVSNFIENIKALEEKLGPVLFQLPPKWKINTDRLKEFLRILPKDFRYTFEFRDTSWFDPQVLDVLKKYNASFCIYEYNGILSPKEFTADFVYVRLHGPDEAYKGK